MSIYTETVELIASATVISINWSEGIGASLDRTCLTLVERYFAAYSKLDFWASATSAQIEEAMFLDHVATDILNGYVSRVETGNVREYALLY